LRTDDAALHALDPVVIITDGSGDGPPSAGLPPELSDLVSVTRRVVYDTAGVADILGVGAFPAILRLRDGTVAAASHRLDDVLTVTGAPARDGQG
jgi:hypothetical protein